MSQALSFVPSGFHCHGPRTAEGQAPSCHWGGRPLQGACGSPHERSQVADRRCCKGGEDHRIPLLVSALADGRMQGLRVTEEAAAMSVWGQSSMSPALLAMLGATNVRPQIPLALELSAVGTRGPCLTPEAFGACREGEVTGGDLQARGGLEGLL